MLLEGKWNNRNYKKQDNSTVYVNEVIVERIELVKTVENSQNTTINTLATAEEMQRTAEDPFKDFGEEIEIRDEDLPF